MQDVEAENLEWTALQAKLQADRETTVQALQSKIEALADQHRRIQILEASGCDDDREQAEALERQYLEDTATVKTISAELQELERHEKEEIRQDVGDAAAGPSSSSGPAQPAEARGEPVDDEYWKTAPPPQNM